MADWSGQVLAIVQWSWIRGSLLPAVDAQAFPPPWAVVAPGVDQGNAEIWPSESGNVRLLVSPPDALVEIAVRGNHQQPNVKNRVNLSVGLSSDGASEWTFLKVEGLTVDDMEDAYAFVSIIGNEVESEGRSFANATAHALESFGYILAKRARMSADKEIGLLGELLFLRALIRSRGLDPSLQSWIGPDGGVHDFEIDGVSFEVKTTRSPERKHHIANEHQLEQTLDAELRLVSIQMVKASGADCWGLPALVAELEELGTTDAETLRRKLTGAGWSARHAGAPFGTWKLSNPALEFVVDDGFPRLTSVGLAHAANSPELISDVSYVVHLDQYPPSEPLVIGGDFA